MGKIQINFTNRSLYTFILIAGILVLGVGVYAYNSGGPPSVMGHDSDELDGVCRSDGIECDFLSNYYTRGEIDDLLSPFAPTIPEAPINLAGEYTGETASIDLSWSDLSYNEDSFRLSRKAPGEINYALIFTSSSNVNTYTDNGIPLDSGDYAYKVTACLDGYCSRSSDYTVLTSEA
jgi:hypothetical protein